MSEPIHEFERWHCEECHVTFDVRIELACGGQQYPNFCPACGDDKIEFKKELPIK